MAIRNSVKVFIFLKKIIFAKDLIAYTAQIKNGMIPLEVFPLPIIKEYRRQEIG
jgi:hypothetical protein